jgi:hypothetical protein
VCSEPPDDREEEVVQVEAGQAQLRGVEMPPLPEVPGAIQECLPKMRMWTHVQQEARMPLIQNARSVFSLFLAAVETKNDQKISDAVCAIFRFPGEFLRRPHGTNDMLAHFVHARSNGGGVPLPGEDAALQAYRALPRQDRDRKQIISLVKQDRARKGAEFLVRDKAVEMNQENLAALFARNERLRRPLQAPIPPPPFNAPKVSEIDPKVLEAIMRRTSSSGTPDIWGWLIDLIIVLYADPTSRRAINALVRLIANDELPSRAHQVAHTRKQMAVPKKGGIRSVGWSSSFTAIAHAYVLSLCTTGFLAPEALAHERGAAARAVTVAQAVVSASEDSILVCFDLTGAYPSTDRGLALKAVFEQESLAPAFLAIRATYREPTTVLTLDPRTKEVLMTEVATNGVHEGGRFAGLIFCTRMMSFLRDAVSELNTVSVSIMDDTNLVGGMADTLIAARRFRDNLPNEYDINNRSFALWPHSTQPPAELVAGCRDLKIDLKMGWAPVLGGVVANFEDGVVRHQVTEHLDKLLAKHKKLFEAIADPMLAPQVAFQILRCSAAVRVHFLLRLMPPSVIRNLTKAFDKKVQTAFESIIGVEHGSLTVDQGLQLGLPVSGAGFGIRRNEDLSPLAYVAHHAEIAVHVNEACENILDWRRCHPLGCKCVLSASAPWLVSSHRTDWRIPGIPRCLAKRSFTTRRRRSGSSTGTWTKKQVSPSRCKNLILQIHY